MFQYTGKLGQKCVESDIAFHGYLLDGRDCAIPWICYKDYADWETEESLKRGEVGDPITIDGQMEMDPHSGVATIVIETVTLADFQEDPTHR